MKNSIKIKNGKKHYYIENGEIKYISSHKGYRNIDVKEIFKAINNSEEIAGIQEIMLFKITSQIEEEYFENLLKITSTWKSQYHDSRILDGNQWSVKITYNNINKSFYGSNDYPDNWNKFEEFLKCLISNEENVLKEKITVNSSTEESIDNKPLNIKDLRYSLLELSIYYVLGTYPRERQTLFNCACVLNEELGEIYAGIKDLLCIQSNDFIISHLSEMFLKLKKENKKIYRQLIEDVIEATTYYCMKNSDQLLPFSPENIGLDRVINFTHNVIDYKKNTDLNKYVQMIINEYNNITPYQALDIIKEFFDCSNLKNIENIEIFPKKEDENVIIKVLGGNGKYYYLEVDSNNILISIKENSTDGATLYKGGLDSLFD